MKKILILSIVLLPLLSKAQIKDTSFIQLDDKLASASIEMIKFDKQSHTGFIIEVMGGIVLAAGSIPNNAIQNGTPIMVAGGILSLVGFVIHAASSAHIKNAAIILRGNSIVIPIHKKYN